ncbi:lipopolysaccharide biosynthesis protein [Mariniluteicoccus flavus]
MLSYLGIGLAIVSGLVVTPLLVRYLGREDYAIFSLANSVVTLLAFDLGLNSAVARFVATAEARASRRRTLQVLRIIHKVYWVLDLLFLAVLLLVWLNASRVFPALEVAQLERFRTALLVAGLVMVASFPLQPANGTLQGLERFVALRGSDVAWRILGIAVVLAVVAADLGLYVLVAGTAAVTLVIGLFRAVVCWRAGVWTFRSPRADRDLRREVASYTSWSFLVALGMRMMVMVMPSVLAALSGAHAVAGFAIAAMIEGYVWLIANAVNGLFLPKVARLMADENHVEFEALAIRVGRFQLIILGLVVGGVAAFGKEFMRLWLGTGFDDVYLICLALIVPSLVVQTQEVAMSALVARGEIRYRAACTAVAAVVNLSVAMLLVPGMGALGGAISVACGSVVGYVIAMNMVYARVLKFGVAKFFSSVHLRILPLVGILAVVFLLVDAAVGGESLWAFVLSVFGFLAVYGVVVWLLVLDTDEKSFVKGLVGRG